MKSISGLLSLAIVCVVAASAAPPADALGLLYAGKRKKINCGVVAVTSTTGATNEAAVAEVGNLFYLLDNHPLKPAGWSMENPMSPGSPSIGLGKNNPVYWRVSLSAAGNLSRLDVLYLPGGGTLALSDTDREKLRRFVDGGGVLWIDNTGTGGGLKFQNTFFIQKFEFRASSGYDYPLNRHHSLLTLPYWLDDNEIARLGAHAGSWACLPGYDPAGAGWGSVSDPPTDFDVLFPVVLNSGAAKLPSVAANSYGSGWIVATSNYVGMGCFAPDQNLAMPGIKFAYNVMAWASSFSTLRKDPRHSGAGIDTVGGSRLIEHWSLVPAPPLEGSQNAPMEFSPVISRNVAFYASGDTLYAADIFPSEDLDQDGNPDDGWQDSAGQQPLAPNGQDLIWRWSPSDVGGGQVALSSPTVVSVQDPRNPANTVEAVIVTSSAGVIYMLEAFPTNPAGQLADTTASLLPGGPDSGYQMPAGAAGKPSTPLYINGWIYAVGGDGKLYAYNPSIEAWRSAPGGGRDAAYEWSVPSTFGTGAVTFTSEPRCGPSFSFVRNESSGAVVGMVYWYVSAPRSAGAVETERNDHVYGIPVYVSNDRVQRKQVDQAGMIHEARITYKDGNIAVSPKPLIRIRTPDGISVTYEPNESDINRTAQGALQPGTIVIRRAIGPDAIVYATYGLDYTEGPIQKLILPRIRAALEPKSNAANRVPQTYVVGTPAINPDGLLFVNGSRSYADGAPQAGGSVYGLANDGARQTTKWHYFLHAGAAVPLTTGGGVQIPPVVIDKETFDPMIGPAPVGSPAAAGDKVFVTVKGQQGGPPAALLCFKANPDFVIRITENAGFDENGKPIRRAKRLYQRGTDRRMTVKIWQPNLMMSDVTGADLQPLLTSVPVPPDMIDYDRGTIVFDNFDRLKLRGTGVNVMQTNTFSPSLPVWVYLDNVEVPIDFSTWGPSAALGYVSAPSASDSVDMSQWNNLLWYYLVPPYNNRYPKGISSSPVVIGSTVYFSASYPDIDGDGRDDEVLYALNAETGETTGGQTSQKPIWQHVISGGAIAENSNLSVAGANGVLLVPAGDGLHAFNNATTLVADGSRVVELDGAGEVAWAVDSISWPARAPQTSGQAPPRRAGSVNRPARAKYIGSGDVLVVNSGANQIARINRSGWVGFDTFRQPWGEASVRWLYDRFCDPGSLLRPGQPTGLRGPTDAIFWHEMEPDKKGARPGEDYTLVVHCLVADSGNHRILDLVYRIRGNTLVDRYQNPIPPPAEAPDRYDPASGFVLPELNWVTRTDSMNERYIYDCIQLVGGDTIWAAVSNYRTGTQLDPPSGSPTSRGLGGAIVALGYRTHEGFREPWSYNAPGSGQVIARCDRMQWPDGIRPLAGPRYFQVLDKADARYMLVCDNYGVYVARMSGGAGAPVVQQALTDLEYRTLARELVQERDGQKVTTPGAAGLGAPLQANSVQELPNGNWLIANGYSGNDKMAAAGATYGPPSNPFGGEVFEFVPDPSPSKRRIVWSSPSLVIPGLPNPAYPGPGQPQYLHDPEVRRQSIDNSYVLQQPRCALRRF